MVIVHICHCACAKWPSFYFWSKIWCHHCVPPPQFRKGAKISGIRQWQLMVFITVQNLVAIDAVVSKIWKFEFFTRLASKRLFTPPKLGFLGGGEFDPLKMLKWTAVSTKPQKGTSLRESASFKSSSAKIRQLVWPVGEFPKMRA